MFKTLLFTFVVALVSGPDLQAWQENDGAQDPITRSARRLEQQQRYLLQYRMKEGETVRWQVEQIATTDATIGGFSEETSLRTRSVIAWKVLGVDGNGNITIQDQLDSAIEWQKIGDADPVSYDSTVDIEVPDIYQDTASKIGKPISTTTISSSGQVIQKESHIKTMEFGMGKFTLPLPPEPVAIGYQWNTPEELQARRGNGTLKTIKTRMLYTLRKVEDGVATISFRREVLTPIDDPKVKSQIQQKLNQGALLFDIENGRVKRRVVQWDEKVQGFEGDDSYLHYVGNYTMDLLEDDDNASHAGNTNPLLPRETSSDERSSSRIIRPRDGDPIIRK